MCKLDCFQIHECSSSGEYDHLAGLLQAFLAREPRSHTFLLLKCFRRHRAKSISWEVSNLNRPGCIRCPTQNYRNPAHELFRLILGFVITVLFRTLSDSAVWITFGAAIAAGKHLVALCLGLLVHLRVTTCLALM
jgi:hypothetical protein